LTKFTMPSISCAISMDCKKLKLLARHTWLAVV
jgi:hypothetical protein